jgi:DNA-binding SARP family transcriptional activator
MSSPEQPPLQIRLLGELQVLHGGRRLALPPSKKTRALLGYLLLNPRPQRRERLCELFWDVADDPRAALRWSLSKLRELLDGAPALRLLADREQVAVDMQGMAVDALTLKQLLAGGPETASDATLQQALPLFRGELLEGLELPEFLAYNAFCVAERSALRELHRRVLSTLLGRCQDRPAEAVPLLSALVQLDPLDSQRRAQLFELLQQAGRAHEADQQLRASDRLLASDARREPALESERASVMAAPSSSEQVPFTGRKAELARLAQLLGRPERGLRLALVTGDPGIGKSRLLQEALQVEQVRGGRVRRAAVQEGRLGFPYAPFRELLQWLPLAAQLAWIDGAPDAATLTSDGERGREKLFHAVADQLAKNLVERPLVLVLEDVQWLDAGSLALLQFLSATLCAAPLTFLLSARRGELHDQPMVRRVLRALRRDNLLQELVLGPLSAEETAQLVAALHSRRPAHDVLIESAGHPLYAIELSRQVSDTALPGSLLELVRDRIAALPPEPTELLRWASVLGSSFASDTLGRLLTYPPEQLVEALEHLERHGFLQFAASGSAGTCQFAHELVRHALYVQLSEPRRRLMHTRVARLAMGSGQLDDERAAYVAHHASLGGDQALAADACLTAGQRCLRMFAPSEALTLARRGLQHAHGLDDAQRLPVSLGLLQVALAAARHLPQELVTLLSWLTARALDLGHNEQARQGFFLQSLLTWEAGRSTDASRFSREAERISRAGSLEQRLLGLGEAARCLVVVEDGLPDAEAFLMEAEALAQRARVELPYCASLARGALQLYRGDYELAERTLEQACQQARRAGERLSEFYALEHLVDLHLQRAQYAQAVGVSGVLCELAERLRQGSELPFARAVSAVARYANGADTPDLHECLVQLERVDAKQRCALVLSRLAQLTLQRGQLEFARGHAQRAHFLARAIGRVSEEYEGLAILALSQAKGLGQPEPVERLALLVAAPPVSAHTRRLIGQALEGQPQLAKHSAKTAKKRGPHGARDRRTNDG